MLVLGQFLEGVKGIKLQPVDQRIRQPVGPVNEVHKIPFDRQRQARPPRTVFSLAAEAEPLFLDWVHRPVARIREVRLDFLIKLYFAQRLGGAEAKTLLEAQIAVCQDYLERQKAGGADLKPASFEHLVQESKLTAAESTLSWLNRIAGQSAPRKRKTVSVDK